MEPASWFVIVAVLGLTVTAVVKSIVIVPREWAYVVERLGCYHGTREAGPMILVPAVDRVRARVDLRDQVLPVPPQPVVTRDDRTVEIGTVVHVRVHDVWPAVYEIANYIAGVEQVTTTALRNVVGGLTLEQTLSSQDRIDTVLREELDEATGRWGIRVGRVEIAMTDPRATVPDPREGRSSTR